MSWPKTERATAAWTVPLALALGVACRTPVSLALKDDFVVVDRDSEKLRAIAADEARVRLRQFDAEGGTLTFWREALRSNLVDGRGYVLLSEQEVVAGSGARGHEMVLETSVNGRPVRYLVTLFVETAQQDKSHVRVVEYVADKSAFDRHLTGVRQAISRL